MNAKVFLVGAGPGDPGLITVKGQACIAGADVIIYDYLAAPALLEHASAEAELIYVGKKGGDHTLSQEGINDLLVQKASTGKSVTRLKGGDPFIFGRGGEEVEALVAAGIPFEIVPGVTSAIAAPAYAGIPLTHRKFTSTLAFVTGHEDPEKSESSVDWKALATGIGTLVFFMGMKNLAHILDRLKANGMPSDRPVAVVRWGTTARQQTVTGTLDTIEDRVREAGLAAPALIVVGDVVGLRGSMRWFERRPLLGRRVVVTRARAQASDLVRRLADLGADCLECPTIAVAPPQDYGPLDAAITALDSYDWIVFTSVNGVAFFFNRLFESGRDVRALHRIRTAAIGPATAAELLRYGLRSDIVPENYRAEAVVEAFGNQSVAGCRILLPRALEARPVLPRELSRMGAEVDEVPAYRTQPVKSGADRLIRELKNRQVDLVTFTSSSTVTNFKALLPDDRFDDLLQGVTVASIGPITTRTAQELGFSVHISAAEYTIPGLVDAIRRHYGDTE